MSKILKVKLPNNEVKDLGALSSNVIYDGDTGVTTTLNEKIQSIFTTLGDINSFEVAVTPTLPTTTIDDHTIYFIPNEDDSSVKDEYMYIGNQWELIGSTSVDLTDYALKSEIPDITIAQGSTTGVTVGSITVDGVTTILYANAITIPSAHVDGQLLQYSDSLGAWSNSDVNHVLQECPAYFVEITADQNEEYFYIDETPEHLITLLGSNRKVYFTYNNYVFEILQANQSTGFLRLGQINSSNIVIFDFNPNPDDSYQSFKGEVSLKHIPDQISATVTPIVATGTAIADIEINGLTTTLYAPAAITPPAYSLSMSGATITLLADNVAASTITLPIYDGTVV